jgi:hypothetical protein
VFEMDVELLTLSNQLTIKRDSQAKKAHKSFGRADNGNGAHAASNGNSVALINLHI